MTFRHALRKAGTAARTNFLPGLLLQALMLVFLSFYLWHEETQRALSVVALFKQQTGYAFAFVAYAIAGGLLPELLRVFFFQRGRVAEKNLWNVLTAAPFWGLMGVTADFLYRSLALWFGTGSDAVTVLAKMATDQFLYSPFISAPLIVGYLHWRDEGFRLDALREVATKDFWLEHIFPIIVAGWCVWIPGVSLVYFMPSLLQLPVAVLIQVFWVLIVTTVSERKRSTECGHEH